MPTLRTSKQSSHSSSSQDPSRGGYFTDSGSVLVILKWGKLINDFISDLLNNFTLLH